jgi:hypothetical protein
MNNMSLAGLESDFLGYFHLKTEGIPILILPADTAIRMGVPGVKLNLLCPGDMTSLSFMDERRLGTRGFCVFLTVFPDTRGWMN